MLLTKVDGGIVVGHIAPEAYNLIRRVEDKIRAAYKEAEFELLCGPDDALHLKVYTNDEDLWGPLQLVERDLLHLQETEGLNLHVVPLRFEDREDPEPENDELPESLRRSTDDEGAASTPGFLRNLDSR